jgi:murein DD-endopeptidase MepM/ murein hydrolase activator NlpD
VYTKGVIPVVGLVLCLGCAQGDDPPARPHGSDIRLVTETETIESTVPRHATLDTLLRANRLQSELVDSAVSAARAVFDVRRLRADRPYRLVRSIDGLLREFEYGIDADRFLRIVVKDEDRPEALDAQVLEYAKRVDTVAIDARIDVDHPSLIAAIDEAGENVQLAMALAEIFAGQVDFQSDLQQGDSFRVLFEKQSHDGQFSGYGPIVAAEISVDGKRLEAIRWPDPVSARPAYYDGSGRSLRRLFLKSPLRFEPRITSGFSFHRLHPVDHVYKAHLGVDYGAPLGAPVVAVASGVVLSAAYSGAGGNMVRLKHAGGFETYYLHLSSFGSGVHVGARVEQGQLIGRVGMTGSATGPHLDFRIRKNGGFVNPVLVHSRQAPGDPIPAAQLAMFRASRDKLLSQLSTTLLASAAPKPDAVGTVVH